MFPRGHRGAAAEMSTATPPADPGNQKPSQTAWQVASWCLQMPPEGTRCLHNAPELYFMFLNGLCVRAAGGVEPNLVMHVTRACSFSCVWQVRLRELGVSILVHK